jgi:hypothetical protein
VFISVEHGCLSLGSCVKFGVAGIVVKPKAKQLDVDEAMCQLISVQTRIETLLAVEPNILASKHAL